MEHFTEQIIRAMVRYNRSDPRRVQHALKVFAFADSIGKLEGLDPDTRQILNLAAVLHDIGIRNSERKYGSSAGPYQEKEGPPVARELLREAGVPEKTAERVCFLIGHHHTYTQIDGPDYQILVEADFLVNLFEDQMPRRQAEQVQEKIFRTKTGKEFLSAMYLD